MTRIDKYSIIIFLSISTIVFCQDQRCPCEIKMENEKKLSAFIGMEYIDKHTDNPLQYFYEWSKGEVYFTNGENVKNEFILYNVLLDEVLWMKEYDHKKLMLDRKFIKAFVIHPKDSDTIRFIKVDFKNNQHADNKDTFMQLLCDGSTRLLKYVYATEVPYTGEIYYKEVYYLNKNNLYSSFTLKRGSLYQLFPDDKKTLKQIFRANHLSVKKEEDLIRAFELYDHPDNI